MVLVVKDGKRLGIYSSASKAKRCLRRYPVGAEVVDSTGVLAKRMPDDWCPRIPKQRAGGKSAVIPDNWADGLGG